MKEYKLMILGVMVSVLSYGAAPFTLSFKTSDTGDNANILAVYIRTAAGTYVDTIGVYGSKDKYINELGRWQIDSGISSYSQAPADARMGATRSNYYQPSPVVFTWDLKDSSGNIVPDGTYKIYMCSAHDGKDSDYDFNFVKNTTAGMRSVPSGANFTDISIAYAPPVPNTAPFALALSVSATNGNPVVITLGATDAEDNLISYNIVSPPASGHLMGTPPELTYIPVKGDTGSVPFTFNATDGLLVGNTATVSVSLVFNDTSGNGMPDSWQADYGVTDADADADQDGVSNYEEYMAGTNPTNSASVFTVNVPHLTNGSDAVLQWNSAQYNYYSIQSSTNLLSGWDTVSSNHLATPPVNSYTGTVNSAGATYYRIRREP